VLDLSVHALSVHALSFHVLSVHALSVMPSPFPFLLAPLLLVPPHLHRPYPRPLPQVLLPVYGTSALISLVLHRRGSVLGRCTFKLYGLLPLLIRSHTKALTLHR
jgi:hypothetical protein